MELNTNDFYDKIADHWHLFYKDWDVKLEREGLSLRSSFRRRGIERVLVAASGIGTPAIPLAKLGYDVVATDASAGMLRRAKQLAEEHAVFDQLQFEQATFEDLAQIVSGKFDAVVCKGNALPHLVTNEAIENAVATFYRLLRPGGTLVIGLRDFGQFMEHRPRFLPGFDHNARLLARPYRTRSIDDIY